MEPRQVGSLSQSNGGRLAMKVIALVLGVGAVLFLVGGGCGGQLTSWYTDSHGVVHTHCWSGCSSGTSDASEAGVPDSPIIEDALAIHTAEISTDGDEANIGVFRLVDRAGKMQGRSRDALVQQRLPRLAARITAAMPTVRGRLLALDLQTTAGANCRMAVLRMLARTDSLYRAVSDELATNRAPARVVHEVTTGETAMARDFTSDLRPCLVGLQPESRAAVKYILGG